jgi:rhamnosyltransferase
VIEEIAQSGNPKIQIIKIPSEEFGHGKTRNQAIGQSNGEFVAVITQDAKPSSNHWLQSLVNEVEKDTQIAGVFGRHLPYPEADIFTKRDFQKHFDGFREEPVAWLADKERYKTDEQYRQKLHFFSDNNALLRRSVWEQIPYPDVAFAEDQQWAKLIIEAGWKKAYSEEGAVFHSHNYSLIDLFRRSIDESRAMKEYFNYSLSPSLKSVLRSWVGFSVQD